MSEALSGRKVAILVADGFEKVELMVPYRFLQLNGAEVDIISLESGKIRGMNMHEPAGKVAVDFTLDEADAADYDGLFIPGGFINPDILRQSKKARDFVISFSELEKPIASICHGPWVLASAGLLEGRMLTSWPGIRDDLVHAGATWINESVVWDENLMTSRGPEDLKDFCEALIDLYNGNLHQSIERVTSDDQVDEPAMMEMKAVSLLPAISLKTALAVGVLAGGFLASRKIQGMESSTKNGL